MKNHSEIQLYVFTCMKQFTKLNYFVIVVLWFLLLNHFHHRYSLGYRGLLPQ